MEPAQTFSALPAGSPRPVDVAAIEQELTQLWQTAETTEESMTTEQAAAPGITHHALRSRLTHSGAGPVVTRACSLNLVILCESEALADRATEVVACITREHPGRALLLIADFQSPGQGIKAWISAHCHLPDSGGPQVCCEQISIRAWGQAIARLAEVMRPLLVPDLPVVLWWPRFAARPESDHGTTDHWPESARSIVRPESAIQNGLAWDDPLCAALLAEADRLIVDTGGQPASGPEFCWLASYAADPSVRAIVSDLNWVRLRPWRELTAQFFDPLYFRPYLDTLDEVVIEYAASEESPGCNSGAALFAAWLASRLGWTWTGVCHSPLPPPIADCRLPIADCPESGIRQIANRKSQIANGVKSPMDGGRQSFPFDRDGTAIQVTLQPQPSPLLPPGEIVGLRLTASATTPPATFLLRSEIPDLVYVAVEVPAACPLPRTVRIDRHDEAHLLCGELEEVGRDRVYEAALSLAAEMGAARASSLCCG